MATIRAERVLESRARFDPAFSVLDAPPVAALHALPMEQLGRARSVGRCTRPAGQRQTPYAGMP